MVRAKFRVDKVEATQQSRPNPTPEDPAGWKKPVVVEMRTIVMSPVSGGSEENRRFWNASPSGELRLGTVNPEAWQQFQLGGEYYLDFTPAPKEGQ